MNAQGQSNSTWPALLQQRDETSDPICKTDSTGRARFADVQSSDESLIDRTREEFDFHDECPNSCKLRIRSICIIVMATSFAIGSGTLQSSNPRLNAQKQLEFYNSLIMARYINRNVILNKAFTTKILSTIYRDKGEN